MSESFLPKIEGKTLECPKEVNKELFDLLRECYDGPICTPDEFREKTCGINHNKTAPIVIDCIVIIPPETKELLERSSIASSLKYST